MEVRYFISYKVILIKINFNKLHIIYQQECSVERDSDPPVSFNQNHFCIYIITIYF